MTTIDMRTIGLTTVSVMLAMSCKVNVPSSDLRTQASGVSTQDILKTGEDLAKQCGIDVTCQAGIEQGNASISGVASVDAFFASVLNFQRKADEMSADLNARLTTIRSDFGIAADADLQNALQAQIQQNCEDGVHVKSEPARCAVDATAALQAQAECDTSIDPAKAVMMCNGSCDVKVDTDIDCGTNAQLTCTLNAGSAACSGQCNGSCITQLDTAAQCDGTCRGTCSGTCSAYSDEAGTQCAGSCDGACQGSCETQLMGDASCDGKCNGECSVTAQSSRCDGAVSAHCEQMSSAMVACSGRCEGELIPPKAKAECEARARAEAKLNVECTPPRLVLDYTLKQDGDAQAQAQFSAALENLRVRLPDLLGSLQQANAVTSAGEGLVRDADGAVRDGIKAAERAVLKGDLRTLFGLACAAEDAGNVASAIQDSSDRLNKSVQGCAGVKAAIGAP